MKSACDHDITISCCLLSHMILSSAIFVVLSVNREAPVRDPLPGRPVLRPGRGGPPRRFGETHGELPRAQGESGRFAYILCGLFRALRTITCSYELLSISGLVPYISLSSLVDCFVSRLTMGATRYMRDDSRPVARVVPSRCRCASLRSSLPGQMYAVILSTNSTVGRFYMHPPYVAYRTHVSYRHSEPHVPKIQNTHANRITGVSRCHRQPGRSPIHQQDSGGANGRRGR